MLFLLIFLFFQVCLTVAKAKKNITGQLFLGSPVEGMTTFKYKLTKCSSLFALFCPAASVFYFRYFQKVKTEKILKNKFFLSGLGICTVGALIGIKKTYDLDQYVLHCWPLIFYIYRLLNKSVKLVKLNLNRESVIKDVICNKKAIADFLIFHLAKDNFEKDFVEFWKLMHKENEIEEKFNDAFEESFIEAKNFFSKKKPKFDIDKLINEYKLYE